MAEVRLSSPVQDYLKAIYCMEKEGEGVSASRLAESMGVRLPSVTSMIRKLASRRLVSYTPYLSIALTGAGERQALEIVRHHRLLETYLRKNLGFALDALHAEADRLEHAMSAELEEKIDALLGRPAFDPHGSPIPDRKGNVHTRSLAQLSRLPRGSRSVVRQIKCRGTEQLRHLESIGLLPGASVRVSSREKGSGIVGIAIAGGREQSIAESIADMVLVDAKRSSR